MFDLSHALGARLTFGALGLIAGALVVSGTALPAQATTAGFAAACHFTEAPQYEGAERDYEPCMHMQDCQMLANHAGHTIYEAGCFGISPKTASGPATTAGVLMH